jgi:TPR repeat protein
MPGLILKSPYIKCSGKGMGGGGYLRYIGTRDGVELVPDDRPATKRQEQLIRSLVRDFPDTKELLEYDDWQTSHTKVHASAFITTALECNWEQANRSDVYLKYIATRPRVERLGSHGLFSDDDTVDLQKVAAELDSYTGNVWTHIISLKREDAARLGYDRASAWRDLLRQERNEIAAAMGIPPGHFRWYAAFHDEGHHPHVHMMAWSSQPKEGWLDQDGIRKIRSTLTNQIFDQEMLHLYEQKTVSRDELVRQARASMLALVKEMRQGLCDHPEAEELILKLSRELGNVKGQKKYGYLPKPVKKLVDEIVDEMERLPVVAQCYEQWQALQGEVESYYSDAPPQKKKLSERKEFRQIKNVIVAEAERLRLSVLTFEGEQQPDEDDGYNHARNEWYWKMKQILDSSEEPIENKDWAVTEMWMLADYNVPQAWYMLGKLYRDGGVLIPDSALAVEQFKKAAQAEVVPAQCALGELLLSDDLDVRDPQTGVEWLDCAWQNGSLRAGYRLAKEYLSGENIAKDISQGLEYLTACAKEGHPGAQYLLGKLYLTGQEVPQDAEQAEYWLSQAVAQGNEYAGLLLERMAEPKAPVAALAVVRLLHGMSRIFQDNSLPKRSPIGMRADRKLLQRIQEKKIAIGHKPDDHPDEGMTMGW